MEYEALIQSLVYSGALKTPHIISAFKKVDRADFLRENDKTFPYGDYPIPIGFGQTNSQPSTVAFMLELLEPRPGDRVLDVGSGSGWTTALLAEIVGEKGEVLGFEIISELAAFGLINLSKYNFKNARIQQSVEDFSELDIGLFDKILVSASAPAFRRDLLDKLKADGVIVIPVGNTIQRIRKTVQGSIDEEIFPGFVFVPLKGPR